MSVFWPLLKRLHQNIIFISWSTAILSNESLFDHPMDRKCLTTLFFSHCHIYYILYMPYIYVGTIQPTCKQDGLLLSSLSWSIKFMICLFGLPVFFFVFCCLLSVLLFCIVLWSAAPFCDGKRHLTDTSDTPRFRSRYIMQDWGPPYVSQSVWWIYNAHCLFGPRQWTNKSKTEGAEP